MVLSNKRLKQKLRAVRAESLAATVSGEADPNGKASSKKPDPNSELPKLLELSRRRYRLSKEEKKRKAIDSQGLDGANGENGVESRKIGENKESGEKQEGGSLGEGDNGRNSDKKRKKKKKRKREEGDSEDNGIKEDGVVKESKKEKKQKEKKKKKKKKAKNREEKMDVEAGGVTESSKGIHESEMNEDNATKVYVGGIPYYSTEDDIRSFFEDCGTITDVDCMTFPDSGKFRGIAIISFKTEPAAKRALARDGADMGGCFLKIQPYKATRANKTSNFAPDIVKGYNRIYVGNLSWDITEDALRKFFSDCAISSIRFGMDKETGEFRGYAHVDFSDDLSMMMALNLDQRIVCERPIKISCAVPKKEAKSHVVSKKGTENHSTFVPASNDAKNSGSSTAGGKIKQRTCYECGEKGHISTDCPKKQVADPTNSKKETKSHVVSKKGTENHSTVVPASNDANNSGLSTATASGKIKRRTCYECGEKGHISTDCRNKQVADPTNSNTS